LREEKWQGRKREKRERKKKKKRRIEKRREKEITRNLGQSPTSVRPAP